MGDSVARSRGGARPRKKGKKNGRTSRRRTPSRSPSRSEAGPDEERIWLGGRGTLPVAVEEAGVIRDVDWVLWLELQSGLIVGTALVASNEPDGCVVRALLESMTAPMMGEPREPSRIHVASERLAAEVRQGVGDRIPIEVCATPELDAMAAALATSLGDEGEERRYLEGDDIDAALIESFFASAGAFARLEPWRIAGEEDPLRLDLPELDVEGAVVSVVGASIESRGFMLFADLVRYLDFLDGDDDAPFGGDGEPCLLMTLLPRSELSDAMQREIDEHRWPTAAGDSCPVIARLGSEPAEIMPTRRDYRIATAVASTLALFVSEHAAAFDEVAPAQIQDSVVDASGVHLLLTYPAEPFEDDRAEDADPADTKPEVRLSAKVYEAVRELDLLSPRARGLLASATPTSDGDGWNLDGEEEDLGNLRDLLSAAAERRIGGWAVAEAAAALRMDEAVELDDGDDWDAAAKSPTLRSLLSATEKLARRARKERPEANARTRRRRGHSPSLYQLKITLRDIRPPIWRRLEVRSDITLARLHDAIQDAMGWTDSHLHQFEYEGELFGTPSDDDWRDIQSERRVRLGELLQHPKDHIEYVYDFGDDWRHRVVLEKVLPAPAGKKAPAPRCTGGRRACPPEDCGGAPGYRRLLHVLANPRDPERPEMLEWVGGHFDPEAFEAPDV
jgi:hypothetical protein